MTFRSTTETRESPGLRSPESISHPVNRLPEDIFVLILRFFANGRGEREPFPTHKPPITIDVRLPVVEGALGRVECHALHRHQPHILEGCTDAFRVLTKVEDLTIVGCKTEPFFWTLGVAAGDSALLPRLQRLTVSAGRWDLDTPGLVQCAKARKGCSRPPEEATLIFETNPDLVWFKG